MMKGSSVTFMIRVTVKLRTRNRLINYTQGGYKCGYFSAAVRCSLVLAPHDQDLTSCVSVSGCWRALITSISPPHLAHLSFSLYSSLLLKICSSDRIEDQRVQKLYWCSRFDDQRHSSIMTVNLDRKPHYRDSNWNRRCLSRPTR